MFTNPHGMHLVTKAQAEKIPALYAQDGKGGDAVVHVRLFHPLSNWSWLILELDPATGDAFGIVNGHESEYGYFNLNEIAAVRVRGLGVERDCWVDPMTVREAIDQGHIPADGLAASVAIG